LKKKGKKDHGANGKKLTMLNAPGPTNLGKEDSAERLSTSKNREGRGKRLFEEASLRRARKGKRY